jgi:triacylglycerol esterase/lipase EstA (alpha/beta hydrolase family)
MSLKALFLLNLFLTVNAFSKPIFIVPGLGGGIIRNQKNNLIWPPPLHRWISPNWLEDLRISYNHTQSEFYIPHKYETCTEIHSVYNPIIKQFDNVNIAPYDFRLVGNDDYLKRFYEELKYNIETQVCLSDKKCVIVGHSLAGLILHDFLVNYCSKNWKKTYIDKMITINTPYSGSVFALNTLHEKKITYPYVRIDIKFDFARYTSGILWTLPNKYCFPDEIIYRTDENSYTTSQLSEVLTLLDKEETYYLHNKHFNSKLKDINQNTFVETHVLYGTGQDTISCINSNGFNEYDDGDGTVTTDSLTYQKRLKYDNIFLKEFKGTGHHTILNSKEFLKHLKKLIAERSEKN